MPRNLTVLEMQQQCFSDSGRFFPEQQTNLPFMVLALCGEVGELANALKKLERGSKEWNDESRYELAMEMADVFTYLLNCAMIIKVDLEKAYLEKRALNVKRFSQPSNLGEAAGANGGVRGVVRGEASRGGEGVRGDSIPTERHDGDDRGGAS